MKQYLADCLRKTEFEAQLLDTWKTSEAEPIINRRVSGVYLLAYGANIVYVGQSQNILKRIGEHLEKGVQFQRYLYVEEEDDFARRGLEGRCIRYFKPEYNNTHLS